MKFSLIAGFCIAFVLYMLAILGYVLLDIKHIKVGEYDFTPLSLGHFQDVSQDLKQDLGDEHLLQSPKKEQLSKQHYKSPPLRSSHSPKASPSEPNSNPNPSNWNLSNPSLPQAQSVDSYTKHVYEIIAKHYARSSLRSANTQGEVSLNFRISLEGRIEDIQIIKSSHHSKIDKAVLNVLKGIQKDLKKPSKPYSMSITLAYGKKP